MKNRNNSQLTIHHSNFWLRVALCIIICAFGGSSLSQAQTVVLREGVSKESTLPEKGPNLESFTHFYLSLGITVDEGEAGADTRHGFPGEYAFGFRTKYKAGSVYALGWELMFSNRFYRLKQNENKSLPDTVTHLAERFQPFLIGLSFFNRFNFDPNRGNFLGKFLDLGIAGQFSPYFAHITRDENEDGSKRLVTTSKLPYVNWFNYDVYARLGSNKLSVYASYRLSDFFKSKYAYPELPRLIAGLDLAIFNY